MEINQRSKISWIEHHKNKVTLSFKNPKKSKMYQKFIVCSLILGLIFVVISNYYDIFKYGVIISSILTIVFCILEYREDIKNSVENIYHLSIKDNPFKKGDIVNIKIQINKEE